MKNLALLIEYNGTNFGGWQIQPNSPTIQEEIQNALFELIRKPCLLIGAGRTDAGVHAAGQVANTLIDDDFPIPESKIAIAINSKLPEDIRIKQAVFVSDEFHARYDAIAREYEYFVHTDDSVFLKYFSTFYKYPIDEDILFHVANIFKGEHDFTSYSKHNPSTKSYICKVDICEWDKISETQYRLSVRANRFVYGMIRSMVGAMLDTASSKIFPTDLLYGLQNPSRDNFIKLAPAAGLIFKRIYYPSKIFAK